MISEKRMQLLDQYNKALALYKERKWQEALNEFKKALEIDPEDGPSGLYLERAQEYLKNPPGADWDGVFVMKTK
ncbi:MAG: tetratricopeptide repeat protein [Spirochaetales bacterium]|nr:tetratricopeptide repeat protein [Leptospiraceae bacterium]MCP5480703.1 tetratricopeptide repeat protein [Spirochaetales bacterium]MCP5484055.1 tetratricopeptide repeat protein [Spirochaetales bacterium]